MTRTKKGLLVAAVGACVLAVIYGLSGLVADWRLKSQEREADLAFLHKARLQQEANDIKVSALKEIQKQQADAAAKAGGGGQ